MKNLFIPLKTEYYRAFQSGIKVAEARLYGRRWNEKTCSVGRLVTLSKGYGKNERMEGEIVAFRTMINVKQAITDIYPDNAKLAIISIDITKSIHKESE